MYEQQRHPPYLKKNSLGAKLFSLRSLEGAGPTRPRTSPSKFRAKVNKLRTLCLIDLFLLALELPGDSEIKTNDDMTFISVANSYMRRTEGTIPLYFPDERHFRMTRQTHELSTRAVTATLCTYQWFAPEWGGGGLGNPGKLDFVRRTWVRILTSTAILDSTAILKS